MQERNPLQDLYEVGLEKPMGYLPLETITTICQREPGRLAKELGNKDLEVEIFPDGECLRKGGMLYAYHDIALSALLQKHKDILRANNWPNTTSDFVNKTATVLVPIRTDLFTVIADAFADYSNQYRTF